VPMSIELIKQIRQMTVLPLKDIQKAIEAVGTGDTNLIITYLREQGVLKQQSRNDRDTNNGAIFSYVHEGRVGAMLVLKCETDFVARSDDFLQLGNDLALHIAAFQPRYVSADMVDEEYINSELAIARVQLENEGKPADKIEMILEGKRKKISEESALMSQSFIRSDDMTVSEAITQVVQKTGENINVDKFVVYTLN